MTTHTWQSRDRRYTVCISNEAMQDLGRMARSAAPLETGTPLLGEYSDDQSTAYVLAVAPLTPDSHGHRSTFQRGVSGLDAFFSSIFRKSRGRRHYVGEWHSHPGGVSIPSSTDDENMFAIASDPKSRCPECILIIASVVTGDVAVRAYVYSRRLVRIDLFEITARSACG
jgi:integrative and conjugative element protein (TIGR02256 family)